MNNDQLNLIEKIEEIKREETPYFNAMKEPLPWEINEVKIYKAKIKRKK